MLRLILLEVLLPLVTGQAAAAAPVTVAFQINDSYVKDKAVANVNIRVAAVEGGPFVAGGTSDEAGRLRLSLEPGDYFVDYDAAGYVPIHRSPIRVGPAPVTITTTLTMMMEDSGAHTRIQIVLNWGSRTEDQARDLDAHLLCPCKAESAHIYFRSQAHSGTDHSAELDVDDQSWGGPETITITDPVEGSYTYWIYDYSGSDKASIGNSDVVVRVVINDRVAGEYRVPLDVSERVWRPFQELTVGPSKETRIVAFSQDDLAARLDRRVPPDERWPPGSSPSDGTSASQSTVLNGLLIGLAVFLALLALGILRRYRRLRQARYGD